MPVRAHRQIICLIAVGLIATFLPRHSIAYTSGIAQRDIGITCDCIGMRQYHALPVEVTENAIPASLPSVWPQVAVASASLGSSVRRLETIVEAATKVARRWVPTLRLSFRDSVSADAVVNDLLVSKPAQGLPPQPGMPHATIGYEFNLDIPAIVVLCKGEAGERIALNRAAAQRWHERARELQQDYTPTQVDSSFIGFARSQVSRLEAAVAAGAHYELTKLGQVLLGVGTYGRDSIAAAWSSSGQAAIDRLVRVPVQRESTAVH